MSKVKILFPFLVIVVICIYMTSVTSLTATESETAQACDCPNCSQSGDEDAVCLHDEDTDDEHDDTVHESPADEGHDHETGEMLQLDPESEHLLNIKTVPAQAGSLASVIRLTGQIRMNQDTLAHIAPLAAGVVRQVNKQVGDRVEAGEILAWLDSRDLAEAKVKYLGIQAEIGCCALNLTRAQAIYDATQKLIDLLENDPSLDELYQIDGLEMGDNRSVLVKAYAEYTIAKSSYNREKPLYEQKITSKEEYLTVENRFRKAEAEYKGALDTVRFKIRQNLLEVQSEQTQQEIALEGAKRTLYILGQTNEDIERLDLMAFTTNTGQNETTCTDPNCETCLKEAELAATIKDFEGDYERLGGYPLRAGFDGTIIDKHITLGERLSEETAAFTIADLDTVWVDFDVFPKDLGLIAEGQMCTITSDDQVFEGTVIFISPVLNPETRTATARIVADNTQGNLRPGLFVTATLYNPLDSGHIIVPKLAIQTVNGETGVFIQNGESYSLRHVTVGQSNAVHSEVLSGLTDGEHVVTQGAFDLKAKIVTSTLDSHAGHGH